jgi:hypothetical protein
VLEKRHGFAPPLLEALEPRLLLDGSVMISEFMADNDTTLQDGDLQYSDWLEIHNPGTESVDLTGWTLKDSKDTWEFPDDMTLGAGEFRVIFCSDGRETVTDPADPYFDGIYRHTNFKLSAGGEYLGLFDNLGAVVHQYDEYPDQFSDISYGIAHDTEITEFVLADDAARYLVPSGDPGDWTSVGFDDSGWSVGDTGIGYSDLVPGFAVQTFKANQAIANLGVAIDVINNPAMQSFVSEANPAVINYYESGGQGHYTSGEINFPGISGDQQWYAVVASGVIDIPAAGTWSFGVNSDDGFQLTIPGATTTAVNNSSTGVGGDTISFWDLRGSQDTIGVFNFPSAGAYDLRMVFFENEGGASCELFAAQGSYTSFNAGVFDLVGDTASGGLAVQSTPISGGGGGSVFSSLIETDVQGAMQGTNASMFVRLPFAIDTPGQLADIQSLTLKMKYDDGYVAYLNGVEIDTRGAPVSPVWNSNATVDRNDAQATVWVTVDVSSFIDQLSVGTNILAIHGLNYTAGDRDFLILPELLEIAYEVLDVHYFAAASPNDANTQDHWMYVEDTKFSESRGFYSEPFDLEITTKTEGAAIYYTLDGTEPSETNGTLYSSPIAITGSTAVRAKAFKADYAPTNIDTQTYIFLDDVLTQAADGQAPEGWPASWGGNTVDYGMDPDIVNHPDYADAIKDSLQAIPSFSVVMNLDDMFGDSGIYSHAGEHGIAWERASSLELIDPDGVSDNQFQVEAGIRIRGGYSRSNNNPKHALRFFFRNEYGDAKLKFPLFGAEGTDTFDGIDLRTAQNYSWSFGGDSSNTFLREVFARDVQAQMGQPYTRSEYYHLYINGMYWGLYQSQERAEASYGATYFGGDPEDYDVLKSAGSSGGYKTEVTDGNDEAYRRLWQASQDGFVTDAAYYAVQGMNVDGSTNPNYERLLDMGNLIDYMIGIYYGGDRDAPISNFLSNNRVNNFFSIYNRENPTGFKFFRHDAEHSLDKGMTDRTGPYLHGDLELFDYFNPQTLHQKLTAHPDYRMLFADHVHRYFANDGVLTPEGAAELMQERADQIDQAIIAESARWGDAKRATPYTRETWLGARDGVLNFLNGRTDAVLQQFKDQGWYPNTNPPALSINGSPQHGGIIDLGDSLTISASAGTVYYTLDGSDPIDSQNVFSGAIPLNSSMHVKTRAYDGSEWSALCEATFYVDIAPDIRITEIMYNPSDPTQDEIDQGYADNDDFEYIEIKNISTTQTLPLWGLRFSNGIRYTFDNVWIDPGEYAVVARNVAAFNYRYPGFSGTVLGPFDDGMSLSNSGEKIELDAPVGGIIHEFTYKDGWYGHTDGDGFSLTVRDASASDLTLWDRAEGWRASTAPGGTPGYDDVLTDPGAIIINELLAHSDDPFVDTIELYNTSDLPVDISGWFLSDSASDLASYQIPAMAPIPSGGFAVFYADIHFGASFLLSEFGEDAYLSSNYNGLAGGYREHVDFGASPNNVSFGVHAKSTGGTDFTLLGEHTFGSANASPYFEDLVINEVMYNPSEPTAGEVVAGYDDSDYFEFIEIYNTSATATHTLSDFYMSGAVGFSFGWYDADDNNKESWTLEPGATATWDATLPPGLESYEVFARWDLLDGIGSERNLDGQAKYLIAHDGGATEVIRDQKPELTDEGPDYIDQFGWVSLGTYAFDGSGQVVLTRGTNNPGNWTIADQVKFVRAGHADVVVDNPTLDSWSAVNGPVAIGPGEYVVIVSNRDAFDLRYDIDGNSIAVAGEYTGRLANNGEKVKLQRAGAPEAGPSYFIPYYRVDYVNYDDSAPWAAEADGSGSSLSRLHPGPDELYGNDPASWAPSIHLGTPGAANATIDSTAPTAPSNLAGEVLLLPDTRIELTWTASVEPDSFVDHYEVYRDGLEIGVTTIASFTDTDVSIATPYSYTVLAVNRDQYSGELSQAFDIAIPGITGYGVTSSTTMYIVLSEALDQTSAETPANYSIDGGATILTAALGPDNVTVTLTTSEFQSGQLYTLTVGGIITDSGSLMPPGQQVSFEYAPSGSGFILREYWTGIAGGSVSDLTANPNYPDNPTGWDMLSSFEAPSGWAESYGTRIRGYVHPPTSGYYTFWIASDDGGDLYLSTNSDPGNAARIAYVSGWTNSREWTREANQRSAEIYLSAGQKYYIEALHKEGGGGDNLAVAWQKTGETFEAPIPGNYLSPFVPPPSLESAVVIGPTQVLVIFDQAVTEASAEVISNYEITYLISQTVGISAAVWNPGQPTEVTLTLSAPLVLGGTYTLMVDGVADPSGQPVEPGSTVQFVYSDSDLPSLWLFNSDSDGFSYSDDVFNNTSNPNKASGGYESSGGYLGGGLRVFLGPGRTNGAMSGAWSKTFDAGPGGEVDVSLRYRMIMGEGYETHEYGEVLLEIDGVRYGTGANSSLVHAAGNGNGGGDYDTGWLASIQRITLTPGAHTITIGAYNNGASAGDEFVDAYIDNVSLVAMETTAPIADVTDVAPDPRTAGVSEIVIVFSEEITGLDISDLTLSRDGGGDILTGLESFTSADSITWTLGSLSALTAPVGDYALTLLAVGSGVADLAGNSLALDASDSWVRISTPPFVDNPIADLTVNRNAPVSLIDLSGVFDDADPGDSLTLSVADNSNDALVTAGLVGTDLTLTYAPDTSGSADITIRATDIYGNEVEDTFTVTVTVNQTVEIAARHVFYNNSMSDGGDPAAGPGDDNAIAAGKDVMLPGGTPSPANYSNYWLGVNGIMVDISEMFADPVVENFGFRVTDPAAPGGWVDGPEPTVSVRTGDGVDGSDRVTLVWPDGAIVDRWVEVTVRSDANGGGLGLSGDDMFYFGNFVGDCDGDWIVGVGDYETLVSELGQRGDGLVADFDADGRVGLSDFVIMRGRFGSVAAAPSFPVAAAETPLAASAPVGDSGLELGGASEALGSSVSSEGLRSLTDYWFTEVTSPGSPLANRSLSTGEYVSAPQARSTVRTPLAATGEYDLRPLGDDLADYGDDDLTALNLSDGLVDVLAESLDLGF